MNPDDGPNTKVKAVETTCRILTALQELDGAGVTELAEHLDMSKGAIHKHLKTLESFRFVNHERDEYNLGLRFIDIAEHIKNSHLLYRVAAEELQNLRDEVEMGAWYMVEEDGLGIVMYTSDMPGMKDQVRPGGYSHLHHIAAGKAMLAQFPDEKVDSIVDRHGLPQMTPNTITDREELFEELSHIRKTGVAFNREEKVHGVVAVGSAISDLDSGDLLGAISIGGPTSIVDETTFEEELPERIKKSTKIIEVNTLSLQRSEEGTSLTHLEPGDLLDDRGY